MIRNITLSADENLIARARERAAAEHTSLNAAFRQWLAAYAHVDEARRGYADLMQRLSHVSAGRYFSRDELNER